MARHTRAKRCTMHGIMFDSGAECDRYIELLAYVRSGAITDLVCHPHFDFTVNGMPIGRGYTADFSWWQGDQQYVGETKGRVFRDWPLRRDLFLALYPEITLMVNGKIVPKRKTPKRRGR